MRHLVLLHGWGATGAVWQRQGRAFQETCNVHAPTLPRWETAWVVDFLGQLPLARTVAAGWSLGGMLLLEALAEVSMQPAGVLLVGVPAVFCRREDHPWGQPPTGVRAMRLALQKNARKLLEDFAVSCLSPAETACRGEVAALFRPEADEEYLAAGLDYLLKADVRPRLPQLAIEPVIVQGREDRIVPPAQARYLHERLPGSRLMLLPGAGHLPFFTQAARFNEILKEVMGELVGEDRGNAVPPPSTTHRANPL
jgi:pimeloyl-[acyl-carrier protein] methyl ester esterase